MAPKGKRARPTSVVERIPARSAAAAAANPQLGLLEKAEDPSTTKRRQLGRRKSEEQVERSLEQHFGHISKIVLETTRIDGLLARERILEDMRHNKKKDAGKKRLGAGYWRDLVQEYSQGCQHVSELKVKNPDQSVSDPLVQALEVATRTNPATRTIEPLMVMLQHCSPFNQKEIVGLFKTVSASQSIGRANLDIVLVEIMKYIVRAKQQDEFAEEIRVMRMLFDASLARQFLRLKKAGVQVLTWLQNHMELASMLMDVADLNAVMGAKGSWSDVGPQVARLTSSGQLGVALFGFAGQLVNS
jgi:hypothetical protein